MKIMIIDEDLDARLNIKCFMENADNEVVAEGTDGFDAIYLSRQFNPEVTIFDVETPVAEDFNALRVIHEEKNSKAIVLMTSSYDSSLLSKAKDLGVLGYLVKPVSNAQTLVSTCEIALSNALKLEKIQHDLSLMEKRLADRKVIEKAKGYLMKAECLSEDHAYKKIRLLSMEKKCSMGTVSEIILKNCGEIC
ncbi:response regulator receiver and ANTAR domain protein [Acetitomaculum ruminis DSM 5522]|uniref:Stage 0 sporulation protein A homolog n=1 Tax=Acetitomaculum ruminis DSM 5522 TaxID=1120918 RepID=A0A1I0ZUJ7_9FIRM|nr:ANTAR domain-containing protein [Acetitomaculum ruminis]SFB28756.1 response regulator receiver and ANTAR domain protein [Acetitomaculum ruminis DSM 5522]